MNSDKTTAVEVIDAKCPDVRAFDFNAVDGDAARELGIVISGGVDDRLSRAAGAYNAATRLAVEAGYLLLSVKTEIGHGQFDERVSALGLSRQRSSELMRMAKFASSLPQAKRAELLSIPKTKALMLASADQEVLEVLLEDGADDLDGLSVRELRSKIALLKAQLTDTQVNEQAAKAEAEGLKQRMQRGRTDGVPMMVADLRAEILAHGAKARLGIQSLEAAVLELRDMQDSVLEDWMSGSVQLLWTQLAALSAQVGSVAQAVEARFEVADLMAGGMQPMAYLSTEEAAEVAEQFAQLTTAHGYERDLRAHEREQARPRGRGRPAAAPKAPKGSKK